MIELINNVKDAVRNGVEVTVTRNRFGYFINEGGEGVGPKYRRVTTLLGGIPKPALIGWGMKTVAEFAWEHRNEWTKLPKEDAVNLLKKSPYNDRDRAAERGTNVHRALECYVKKEDIPTLNEDEQSYFDTALQLLKARDAKYLAAEIICVNKTLNYAGTFDLWEFYNGETWLLDYKTSKGVYPNMALQATAYQKAEYAIMNLKPVEQSKKKEDVFTGIMIPWLPEYAQRLGIVQVNPGCSTLHQVKHSEALWDVFQASMTIKKLYARNRFLYGKDAKSGGIQ